VTFSDHSAAARAVAELNTKDLNGRAVHVRLDRDVVETTHNVFVGNLPWALTTEELHVLFEPFNPIECQILTNMYGKSRGFAIVKFTNEGDASRSIASLNSLEISGRNIEVKLMFC
jgi:RNA recognition motif-containing protein